LPSKTFTVVKTNTIQDYPMYCHDLIIQYLAKYNSAHRLWADYVLDLDHYKEFLQRTVTDTLMSDYPELLGSVYILPINASNNNDIPLSPTFGRKSEMFYTIGFQYMVQKGDTENIKKIQQNLNRIKDVCLALNGRPYLYGTHQLTDKEKLQIYGQELDHRQQLKLRIDPNNILNPMVF